MDGKGEGERGEYMIIVLGVEGGKVPASHTDGGEVVDRSGEWPSEGF